MGGSKFFWPENGGGSRQFFILGGHCLSAILKYKFLKLHLGLFYKIEKKSLLLVRHFNFYLAEHFFRLGSSCREKQVSLAINAIVVIYPLYVFVVCFCVNAKQRLVISLLTA